MVLKENLDRERLCVVKINGKDMKYVEKFKYKKASIFNYF